MPSDLRMAVLALAESPEQHEHRTLLAQRAEPFDVWGWPTSLERHGQPARKESRGGSVSLPQHLWPVLGAAACVLLIVGAIFLITGGGGGSSPANNKAPNDVAAGSSPSDFASPSDSVEPSPTKTKHSPSPTPTKHTPTPTPTTHRPAPPPPTHKPTHKPTPGTLSVGSCDMNVAQDSCTFQITAHGGTVHWSITSAAGVGASGSGTLDSGESTTISVSKPDPCTGSSGTVSFSPSGTAQIHYACSILG
jgi:hypothetical protein